MFTQKTKKHIKNKKNEEGEEKKKREEIGFIREFDITELSISGEYCTCNRSFFASTVFASAGSLLVHLSV